MADKEDLLNLARERFPDIDEHPHEVALCIAAQKSGWAYFDKSGKCLDEEEGDIENLNSNPTAAKELPVIRSKLVAWLITDITAKWYLSHKGLTVCGARFVGEFDASFAVFPSRLLLFCCHLTEGIILQDANFGLICLCGTHIKPNSDGCSINAERINVAGSIFLNKNFIAFGETRLTGAIIGGNLECTKGMFLNRRGTAINADIIHVKGTIFLNKHFSARGMVRFVNAKVGGNLECGNGKFKNNNEIAFCADRIKIGGNVNLNSGFAAEGEVRFLGATLDGDLECGNGEFWNENQDALSADGIRVNGTVFLNRGFTSTGSIRFLHAHVNGHFLLSPRDNRSPSISGELSLETAVILGSLRIENVEWGNKGSIDLQHAKVGVLWDDISSWPSRGRVLLDGFTYTSIAPPSTKNADKRREWLELQKSDILTRDIQTISSNIQTKLGEEKYQKFIAYIKKLRKKCDFSPQPYEQLAEIMYKSGHDIEAKYILYTKSSKQHKVLGDKIFTRNLSLVESVHWTDILLWAWYSVLRFTVGFGYKPQLALVWMCGISLLGSLIFGTAHEAMTTAAQSTFTSNASSILKGAPNHILPGTLYWNRTHQKDTFGGIVLADDYPHFNALLYSLDTLIPLVDFNLNQKKYWYPNSNHPLGIWLYVYLIFHTTAGWVLVSLLAASLAGVIKK